MRHLSPLLLLAAVFGACTEGVSTDQPTPFGVSSSVYANIPNSTLDAEGLKGMMRAERQIEGILEDDWRDADRRMTRFFEEHRDASWIRQQKLFASHKMLAQHFSERPLSPEKREAAGRYVEILLSYQDIRSEALNATLESLRPHWAPERFRAAVATVAAGAEAAPEACRGCSDNPQEAAAQQAYEAQYAASVASLQAAAN